MQSVIDYRDIVNEKAAEELKNHSCCFYIIRLDDDTFKYGRTTVLALRKANYDIGRLHQVSFYCYVPLDDCVSFEKMFSDLVKDYKIRGKHELIRLPEDILEKILKDLLIRQG